MNSFDIGLLLVDGYLKFAAESTRELMICKIVRLCSVLWRHVKECIKESLCFGLCHSLANMLSYMRMWN